MQTFDYLFNVGGNYIKYICIFVYNASIYKTI